MNVLDIALAWRKQGVATIPIKRRDKRPAVLWGSYHRRLPTKDEMRFWFAPEHNPAGPPNLAVVVGWKNLVVLDFDDLELYFLWRSWCKLQPATRHLPQTYQVLTSRGMHVYLCTKEPALNRKLPSLDIQAQIKYVIAPPSIHPTGHVYTAVKPQAQIITVDCIENALPAHMLVEEQDTEPRVTRITAPSALAQSPLEAAMSPTAFTFDDGPISAIHSRYDITSLVGDVVRRGGKLYTKCPLHQDNDPSMQIDGNRVKCWAGCTDGKWYDYIDLFAALNGISNQQAIQELA